MKIRRTLLACIACMILTMSAMTVGAAGTSSVSISTETPAVGDTFTVTATATESGNMTVKFNENVLSVVNCNVSGYRTSAGEVDFSGKQGTITFKANAAGQSAIALSSSNASSSSMVVNVGSAASNPSSAGASEDFDINGKKYTVSEKFTAEEIPGGYNQVQLQINGKTLKGVSNGAMTLVYLKPVDNVAGQGTFYIYDAATNSVKEYFFLGKPDYYVIPSNPPELISDKLQAGKIDVDGRQVDVYLLDGVNDFAYVYGTSSTNVTGWFQFDKTEKTVQRANEVLFKTNTVSSESENESGLLDKIKAINLRYIFAGIVFVVIVVVVIIINIILKKRDDKADLIDGDEEEPVDEFEDLDKESKKEAKRRLKEEKKREKEERKAAKKEERRRRKEEYFDDEEEDIYDEYDDFDIDKSIDELAVSDEPKVAKETEKDIEKTDNKANETEVETAKDVSEKPEVETEIKKDIPEKTNNQSEDNSDDFAFWEDEKDIKKELKKRKKESKKKKNVFGDDELELQEETNSRIDKSNDLKKSDAKSGGSDIIDFNDF